MATNTLLTNVEISNEALRVLTNSLKFTKAIGANYSDKFGRAGNKIGASFNIRKPVQFAQATGPAFQAQGLTETYTPITLDNWVNRGMQFSTEDMTLSIDLFSDRFIKPAMISAANQIDQYNLEKAMVAVNSVVGTPGSAPSTQLDFNTLVKNSRVRLMNQLAQPGMLNMLGTPDFVGLGSVLNTNVFNPTAGVAEANVKGYITNWGGFNWYESQIVPMHTVGTYSGTPVVDGGDQEGSVINTKSWGAGSTLNVGDVVTFDGCFAVNAQTKQPYTYLQQFVITAKNPAGTTHALSVYPALVASGPAQNVSAAPADGADVTVIGSTGEMVSQALAFEDDAFAIAVAEFEVPANGMGVVMNTSYDPELGMGLTYSKAFDIRSYAELHRIDCLTGFATQRPELATRVAF